MGFLLQDIDVEEDEGEKTATLIYEDQDSDEEPDDAMDTDDRNTQDERQSDGAFDSDEIIEGDDDDDDVVSEWREHGVFCSY